MLFSLTFYLSKNSKEKKKAAKLFITNNKNKCFFCLFFLAENQHIRMITEGSCDTEDWRKHAENSALPIQE